MALVFSHKMESGFKLPGKRIRNMELEKRFKKMA